MKNVLVIVLLAVSFMFAQSLSAAGSSVTTYLQEEAKMKIKKEELPEAARKTLDGDTYKGWAVATVYKLKSGEFEVELKRGESTQKVKFDKDGKSIM